MAYNALNNLIDAYIYANGVQAITGQILNGVLKQMVSQLGSGYHLMGVAGPETVPASNDYAMAYFAATAGEYADFGGITLAAGEVAILLTSGNGSWSKQTIYNVPTGTADLENTANFITNAVTDLVNYYTKTEVDETLAGYPTLADLATALADYYEKSEIDTILAGYTTNTALASALADYYNKNDIDGLLSVVNAALADRYTKSETDTKLADYYKKTETYDKDEVDSIVAALSRQEYIVAWDGLAAPDVSAIPAGVTVTYNATPYTGTLDASASTVNKIYMVWNGVAYDMYGTSQDGGYSWVPMGTTSVDLSQYATKAEVSQLEAKVTDLFNKTSAPRIDIQDGKFIGTNGAEVSNTACSATDYIEVAPGMVIEFYNTFASPNTQQCIAYYGEGKVFVDYFRLYNYEIGKTSFTIPYGVKYVRVSIYNLSIEDFYFSILPVSNNVHIETSSIVSPRFQYVDNTLLNENGVESSNINFLITGYIPVAAVDKLKYFNTIKSIPSANNVFYDKDKNIVSVFANRSDNSEVEEQVPPSAKFVRFSIYKPNIDKFFVSTYNSEAVSTHQQILNNLFEHDPETNYIDRNSDSWVKDALIDGNGNVAQGYTGFYASPFIAITPGTSYYFYRVFTGYYAFYDGNGNVISAHGNDNTLTNPFTAPTGAKYMRITCISQTWKEDCWIFTSDATPPDYKEIISSAYIPGGTVKTFCEYDGNDISVFNKIACVGDSLTQGTFNHNEGGTEEYLVDTKYSYPTYLQKITGVDCENLGIGGFTSAQWYNRYSADDLSGFDAVIIQLGVNDAIQNGGWTAESITAFTNIINKFKQENNGIKIFVSTIIPSVAYVGTEYTEVSQGIRTLVASLNDENVMLLDMAQYGNTGDSAAYNAGHLSAYGYFRLAQDYKGIIGYTISQNKNNFRFVQFIGTNYSYSG